MHLQIDLLKKTVVIVLAAVLFSSFGLFRKKKYENPITKDTLQPDKVLFDRAINDIEHGRYEVARLTLNTLINTYDTSEFLAKAKLAIADSWYREGGAHGLAQAEAEYKDFILFYPAMEEAAESQWKVCDIHYQQMEKADRDSTQAQRTEDECRVLVTQFPNSKFVPGAQQRLRDVQEVLGAKEFGTGTFYHSKGSYPAAANRLSYVADQYPLYSGADEALWQAADSFTRMGDRFEAQAADDYSRIVRDYPLSDHADEAKEKLAALKRSVPTPDPAAVARMQYEEQHRHKEGMIHSTLSVLKRGPDVHTAAKVGAPAMTSLRPPTPVSVPAVAGAPPPGATLTAGTGTSDVAATQVTDTTNLDTKPDARQSLSGTPAATTEVGTAAEAKPEATPDAATAAAPTQPLPTNHQYPKGKKKSKKQLQQEQKLRDEQQKQQQAAAPPQ